MKLSPKDLAEMYDRLRRGPIFYRLKFPPRRFMGFRVTRNKKRAGYFRGLTNGWLIAISEQHHDTAQEAEATMAHEMVHAHLQFTNPGGDPHGPEFQRLADRVCARLGYDRSTF